MCPTGAHKQMCPTGAQKQMCPTSTYKQMSPPGVQKQMCPPGAHKQMCPTSAGKNVSYWCTLTNVCHSLHCARIPLAGEYLSFLYFTCSKGLKNYTFLKDFLGLAKEFSGI